MVKTTNKQGKKHQPDGINITIYLNQQCKLAITSA